MTNRLLAAVDIALDDIAEATGYAHPLVNPDAVAWLHAQYETRVAENFYPTNYVRPMAEVRRDDRCSCWDDPVLASRCGPGPGDDLVPFPPGQVPRVYAVVGCSDPVIPSNITLAAAMLYAEAHIEGGDTARAEARRRAWLAGSAERPPAPF